MPSKESLGLRAEKWLSEIRYDSSVGRGNRGLMPHHIAQLKGPLADLLDEAIREARLEEAEWWDAYDEDSEQDVTLRASRLAQLREGKP